MGKEVKEMEGRELRLREKIEVSERRGREGKQKV